MITRDTHQPTPGERLAIYSAQPVSQDRRPMKDWRWPNPKGYAAAAAPGPDYEAELAEAWDLKYGNRNADEMAKNQPTEPGYEH